MDKTLLHYEGPPRKDRNSLEGPFLNPQRYAAKGDDKIYKLVSPPLYFSSLSSGK
jgi:hypothetical protein